MFGIPPGASDTTALTKASVLSKSSMLAVISSVNITISPTRKSIGFIKLILLTISPGSNTSPLLSLNFVCADKTPLVALASPKLPLDKTGIRFITVSDISSLNGNFGFGFITVTSLSLENIGSLSALDIAS